MKTASFPGIILCVKAQCKSLQRPKNCQGRGILFPQRVHNPNCQNNQRWNIRFALLKLNCPRHSQQQERKQNIRHLIQEEERIRHKLHQIEFEKVKFGNADSSNMKIPEKYINNVTNPWATFWITDCGIPSKFSLIWWPYHGRRKRLLK